MLYVLVFVVFRLSFLNLNVFDAEKHNILLCGIFSGLHYVVWHFVACMWLYLPVHQYQSISVHSVLVVKCLNTPALEPKCLRYQYLCSISVIT